MDTQNAKQRRWFARLALIFFCTLLGFLMGRCAAEPKMLPSTAVVVEIEESCHDTAGGDVRIRMCPDVLIENGTMQNLYFSNLNQDRLMKLVIRLDGEKIYDSPFVKEGTMIQADSIDVTRLRPGRNKVLGEVYYYTMEQKLIGRSDVYMNLILEKE